ncbi:YnfA family protein [Snodgrassella sp. CFCC 13594]|uniref:YnfA family protein n=1 Tax=Snodgrassella sp. CFCC 13594 TaxID=1775559 RepID=UPI000836A1E2|nr:YnfA family protein [Snodgrassella sp. CFCC 13594]
MKTLLLFALTAVCEIAGCYLPWLWLKQQASVWVLLPAALSLAAFVWLLTLHPQAAARTYAAYGGVYIVVALLWLRWVEGIRLQWTDGLGAFLCLMGMAVIVLVPRGS